MKISSQFTDISTIKPDKFKNINIKNATDDKLRNVCNDFEAFFLNQLLEVSLKSSKLAGEGAGSDIIKSMYTDSISRNSAGTLGISDMLYKFLNENKQ
jgi:Rod binding domain-containing protein